MRSVKAHLMLALGRLGSGCPEKRRLRIGARGCTHGEIGKGEQVVLETLFKERAARKGEDP